jgi:hypothetical protein
MTSTIVQNGYELWKNILVHSLKYQKNEVETISSTLYDNI